MPRSELWRLARRRPAAIELARRAPISGKIHRSHPALGLILGLAAVAIFGGSLPATRLAVAGLDPWFVTAGRAAIGGTVAVVLLAFDRPRFPRAKIGVLVLIALCLVIAF